MAVLNLLKGKMMSAGKPEATAKKATSTKAAVTARIAAKSAVKQAAAKPAKAKPVPVAGKLEKKPKVKVIRDFSLPLTEYEKIAEIKEACLNAGLRVKKSEVLRVGLKALGEMDGAQLKRAIAWLKKIKAGRPQKL